MDVVDLQNTLRAFAHLKYVKLMETSRVSPGFQDSRKLCCEAAARRQMMRLTGRRDDLSLVQNMPTPILLRYLVILQIFRVEKKQSEDCVVTSPTRLPRFWIGEIGWSSPRAEALGTAPWKCFDDANGCSPDLSITSSLNSSTRD